MTRKIIIPVFLLLLSMPGFTQVDTIRGEAAQKLIKEITSKVIDTTKFLSKSGKEACACIDSIKLTAKSQEELSAEIGDCIDKEVIGYIGALKLYRSMMNGESNIELNTDRRSVEYKTGYFAIERWLMDSCKGIAKAVASNNKESENSFSKNENAMAAYASGVKAIDKEDYKSAGEYFATAVALDPQFAFAWDNLGLSYRKQGKLDQALEAYKASLRVDPKGAMPLHNIPVVYEYKKEYDKALEAYMNILAVFPDDPEAYYGAGRIYAAEKKDYEKALQSMCKAYNLYIKSSSPYRVDAEKNINFIYGMMKQEGKEKRFYEILEENNIKAR